MPLVVFAGKKHKRQTRGLTRTIFVDELPLDFGCDAGDGDCEVRHGVPMTGSMGLV